MLLFSLDENSLRTAGVSGGVGHEGYNPEVIVKSVENGVGERAQDELVKVEIRLAVDSAIRLNLGQVAVKGGNETISETVMSVLVIPSGCLRNVLQDGREKPDFSHERRALNPFLN